MHTVYAKYVSRLLSTCTWYITLCNTAPSWLARQEFAVAGYFKSELLHLSNTLVLSSFGREETVSRVGNTIINANELDLLQSAHVALVGSKKMAIQNEIK